MTSADDKQPASLPPSIFAELDGMTILSGMIAGRLPSAPMHETIGMRFTAVAPGKITIACTPATQHLNIAGSVHGGWAASVLDTALGCSVLTALKAGETFTTVEFKLNLVKALSADGSPLECIGTLSRRGRSLALSTAELRDSDGQLIAQAMGTCMIMSTKTS